MKSIIKIKDLLLSTKYFTFLIIFIFGLVPFNSSAQHSKSSKRYYNLRLTIEDEYSWLSLGSLNNELQANSLPAINRPGFFKISFRAFPDTLSHRAFFDVQFGAGQSKSSNADYSDKLKIYLFNINFFYTVWHSKRSMFYPGAGLGLMHDVLTLEDKSKTPSTFSSVLTNFQGPQRLITDNPSLNLSIHYSWAMDKEWDFLLNVFAGYHIGLYNPHWKLATGEGLSGAPTSSASGFYIGAGFSI